MAAGLPETPSIEEQWFLKSRLDNGNAFHALALDENREDFELTFWTKDRQNGPGRPGRSADRQGRATLVRWRACERRQPARERSACPTSPEVAHGP
jgi:hypothetical protein